MNVLFLTLGNVSDLTANEIYPDLLREFRKNHHNVYVACGREKRSGLPTELCEEAGIHVLRVRIGNITKVNLIEKGISTLTVERCFRKAIDRYLAGIRFDMIVYSTPPITFGSLIRYLKNRDNAKTYLMLKDIFPQNAVDLGMFGTKSPIYRYFRYRERGLYRVSDHIGCMSQGNVDYLLSHNPQLDASRVEICPNALELNDPMQIDTAAIKEKYHIPQDKLLFLFGGNLGKPQGIDFFMDCLRKEKSRSDIFFVIAGFGTEFERLQSFLSQESIENACLLERLPTYDYNALTAACDVGLLILDHRFTIPNFPSRILPYMQEKKPILAATDPVTDIKDVLREGKFGWWCESNDPATFSARVSEILSNREKLSEYGENGRKYLETHYAVRVPYEAITAHENKRLLIVSQCFYPSVNRGGPAVSVTNLAAQLADRFETSVLTASYESGTGEAYREISEGRNRLFGCDVTYLSSKKRADVLSAIREARPQTLYISSLFSAEYTLPALCYAKKNRCRTVLAPRGELQKAALSKKKLKKLPYLWMLRLRGLMKHVIFHATSEEERQAILTRYPKAEVAMIQNLTQAPVPTERKRSKEENTLRLISVCRIHPIKGIDRAIQALSGVRGQVQYDIYGPAEDKAYFNACKKAAEKLPETIQVNFCGAIEKSKLPQLLAEADAFLLPTETENFGNAIVEALQYGCPAIISNGTPWKNLAQHKAGANADQISDYTDALNRFACMNDAQWREYSAGAKAYICNQLRANETAEAYTKLFGGENEASFRRN